MKRIYTKKNVVFYILMNVQRFIHLAFSEEVHEHWHGAAIAPTASNSGGVVRCGGGRARFFLNNTSNVLFSMCTLLLFAVLWKCCAFIYASTSLHSFGIFLSFQLHYTIVVSLRGFFSSSSSSFSIIAVLEQSTTLIVLQIFFTCNGKNGTE